MLANGHPEAWHYPLGRLSDEAHLIVERDNMRIASEAIALKAAAAAVMTEDGAEHFNELIETLTGVNTGGSPQH